MTFANPVPAPFKVPIAEASGRLAAGWTGGVTGTLAGGTLTWTGTLTGDWTRTAVDASGYEVIQRAETGSFTAKLGCAHIVVATATVTDPTPVEGAGYLVVVRNGTTTIAATPYASPAILYRSFHSGAWRTDQLGIQGAAVTFGAINCTTLTASAPVEILISGGLSRLTMGANNAGSYSVIQLRGNGSQTNWQVGSNVSIGNAFEITPSTVAGGGTYTNPALTISGAGDVNITATTAATSPTVAALTVAGGVGVGKEIVQAATAAVAVDGALQCETNLGTHYTYDNGIGGWLARTLWRQYANATQAGIVTAQSILSGTARGTRTLPANFFKLGTSIQIRARGIYTTDGVPGTGEFQIRFGSTVFRTTGTFTPDISITNGVWECIIDITCFATGVSGSIQGCGWWAHEQAAGGGQPLHIQQFTSTSAITLDTTAAQTVDVLWTASDSGTSITTTCAAIVQTI